MNHQRRQERRRADRAHSRVQSPRWRRLAVEQIESRLMLSGDGFANLDTDTFNFDSIGDYAIISSDSAPAVVTAADDGAMDSPFPRVSVDRDDSPFVFRDAWADGFYSSFQVSLGSLDLAPVKFGGVNLLSTTPDRFTVINHVWSHDSEVSIVAPGNGLGLGLSNLINVRPENSHSTAVSGIIGSDELSIDVPANKLEDKSAPASIRVTPDPALSNTSPAPVVDVRVEPVVTPLKTSLAPEAPTLIAPVAPASSFVAIADSDAQINVGRVIDELLTSDTNVIDQSMQYSADDVTRDEVQLTGAAGTSQVDQILGALEENNTALVANNSTDEGGMIPIQEIVGKVSQESIAAPNTEQVATVDAPGDISGELARVAVMELLEGEADPAAPREASDFTFLVAANEAGFVPERIALNQADQESAMLAAVQAVVDQAALATSLVAPANPIYLAAMFSAASDAFAAASISGPLTTRSVNAIEIDDTRSEAFSQWDDDSQRSDIAEEAVGATYGLLPIVGVLAVERIVAANRKRKQDTAAQAAPRASRSWQV
jgi:hypothetical protein